MHGVAPAMGRHPSVHQSGAAAIGSGEVGRDIIEGPKVMPEKRRYQMATDIMLAVSVCLVVCGLYTLYDTRTRVRKDRENEIRAAFESFQQANPELVVPDSLKQQKTDDK